MIIKKINLINFRNYSKLELNFNEKVNVFIGDNAQGKSNILESITLLALTKSYRIGNDPNLIQFGKNKTKLNGKIINNQIIKDLEVQISPLQKRIFINKTEIKKISDYISNLNVIFFTPDDLEIIKGSPGVRRNLINLELSQLSKDYLLLSNKYNKILKIRNEYLKSYGKSLNFDSKYLEIITKELTKYGVKIFIIRRNYINSLNKFLNHIYFDIAKEEKLMIKYEANIDIKDYDEDYLYNLLLKTYRTNYLKELNQKTTLYGPHRDDFSFYLNDKNLRLFGSQGQQRLAIISYKLSQIPIFEKQLKTKPVLLLDDIFSELDLKKRNSLLNYINKDIQSIITTTDIKNINKKYLKNAYIYEIHNGKIIRK